MFDDLHALFYNSVVLAYTTYVEVRGNTVCGRSEDLRAANAAATALYHFREHIPAPHQRRWEDVARLCPDYDLLGDVVDVAKHCSLRNPSRQITSADAVKEEVVSTLYEDTAGSYSDVRKRIIVKLNDGSERDLFEVMTNVINFWMSELENLGVIKDYKPFELSGPPGARYLTRDEARQLDFAMTKGIQWVQRFRLQRYDPTKGKAESINLTGRNLRFRVYRPAPSLDFGWDDDTGRHHAGTLDLTEEESRALHGLETEEEHREFMSVLIAARKDEIEAKLRAAVAAAEPMQEQEEGPRQ